jgi:hypothetical protein
MRNIVLGVLLVICLLISSISHAGNIGFLGGYGFKPDGFFEDLNEIGRCEFVMLFPYTTILEKQLNGFRFDLDLQVPLAYHDSTNGKLIGLSPALRIHYLLGSTEPYILLGTGITEKFDMPIHMMGMDFNFILETGLGLKIPVNNEFTLHFEYKLWHLSNSGLSDENRGLNLNCILFGVRYGDSWFRWLP